MKRLTGSRKLMQNLKPGQALLIRDELAKILVMATGINASYDYSALLGKLKNGGEIGDMLKQYLLATELVTIVILMLSMIRIFISPRVFLVNSYGY